MHQLNKNISLTVLLILVLGVTDLFASKKESYQKSSMEENSITILDKGIKRTLRMPKEAPQQSKKSVTSKNGDETKKGIIVQFENASSVSIKTFEDTYGLKLKQKLITGKYIFENLSEDSDITLIQKIINEEKKIITVKPNWEKRNLPR